MNEFDVIEVMNEAMIKLKKNQNLNCDENLKIQNSLKDKAYFFKISKQDAFNILKVVGVREESLDYVYNKLIEKDIFFDLLNKGIIKENDSNLIIKYNTFNSKDLFNKKN